MLAVCLFLMVSCSSSKKSVESAATADFVIAFGSCNKASLPNLLWDDISNESPNLWIWGGDNIYADTEDMAQLARMYEEQNKVPGYQKLKAETEVIGTWDDHDYGVNDGGVAFAAKKGSQQAFLDFMGVADGGPRRTQEGVYTAHNYMVPEGTVKVIVLDTRYFRTDLTPDTETKNRNKPNGYGEGTLLGETQWSWLENELASSTADFNIIVSSIQVLSNQHGFECWGNFPHEVDRLKQAIVATKAKGVLTLSGDRHISEISKTAVEGLGYPLLDFTSSGLTHAYKRFGGEPNPFRVGKVVSTESYGVLRLNLKTKTAVLQMVADGGIVLAELRQSFE